MNVSVQSRALALVAGAALSLGALAGTTVAADAATTLTVGNPARCGATDYRTITEAVAAAAPGDTISVCAGFYGESVVINKPDLTLRGAAAGVDARGKRPAAITTTVGLPSGAFTLTGAADRTTIDGFVISNVTDTSQSGVNAFAGSSGLQLINNIIQLNANGLRLQNPDADQPALVYHNQFSRNSANYATVGDQNGSGIFVCCGPAHSTTINENLFRGHLSTAVNFAGDPSQPSQGLVVSENKSVDDATFVVATNSEGAVIDHNNVAVDNANVPGGHGTGILDFGANKGLRIVNNTMKAVGTTTSSGINLRDFAGPSDGTTVIGNSVQGWYNDLRISAGTRVYAASNRLTLAQNDGIFVELVKGAVVSHNIVQTSTKFACEDTTTGTGTAGTANTWLGNRGGGKPSSPAAICRP